MTKKNLILNFIKDNKGFAIGSVVFGFVSILNTLLIPLFLGKFYQLALRTHSTRGTIFDKIFGDLERIDTYFFLFGALILLKLIFDYCYTFFLGISGERFSKNLREKLLLKQLSTQLNIHQQKETGMYLLRYSGDLTSTQNYLTKGVFSFAKDCMFLVLAIILLSIISIPLALIVIIMFPIIFLVVILLNKRLKKYTKERRNIRSQNFSFVSSRLGSLLTINTNYIY